ncbi:MAG TPA: alpha/beta fold hydrolase [Candidatus Eisenbacteria bacterium]|nr:alpha/beta fold hydrolase [Candidatus Eisenbacteria bacterium]
MRLATHRLPGLLLTDHEFEVPLDHAAPHGPTITVFAREVVAPRKRDRDLPWMLYLQGGPGQASPRPTGRSGWLGRALQDHRVLLLDQRGTGRSTPATRQTLAGLGSAQEQARYLTHFRADSIVRDAELIRHELLGGDTWSVLGQSFGGFCALTYLSFAPEGLRQVLVTGGLPPLDRPADDVYRATYERVRDRSARYFDRYPGDQARLDTVADHLDAHDVRLPSGDPFPVARLQQLGMAFGMSDGFERLHYLLETAFAGGELSDGFLAAVERTTSFVDQPLYALLHEAIYCADGSGRPSGWAAARVHDALPEFSPKARPLLPTGEMIYPWMFDTDHSLAPLRMTAALLAAHDTWPALYDVRRLAANTVPVAAAIYHDDMYVEYAYSLETAKRVGNLSWWVTSEFAHDGLRSDARVLDRLLDMAAGEA